MPVKNQEQEMPSELKRELTPKHLMMLAVGGSIGTGLFLTSGRVIAIAGPGGALAAYAFIGAMVYFLMSSLGELAAFLPVTGSFSVYGARFVEPGFGFALGWNYWMNWVVTVAIDLLTTAQLIQYWFPNVPIFSWSLLGFVIIVGLNTISVRGFGEAEYWFACVKVSAITAFLLIGLGSIFLSVGGWPTETQPLYFFWGEGPFVGGWKSIFRVGLLAAFAFQGTELVGIAAGESENPEKSIPKAIQTTFWRILAFYLGSLAVIGCLIPYTDSQLMWNQASQAAVSPFTLVFARCGFGGKAIAHMMNFVILTAVLSAANSGLYAATRMLYNLAQEKMAPAFLKRLSASGIPGSALGLTTLAVGFFFLLGSLGCQESLLLLSSMAGFIAWLGIALAHYRFRCALSAQGIPTHRLPYQASFFPKGLFYASLMTIICIIGQSYSLYCENELSYTKILMLYSGLFLFALLWCGYYIYSRKGWVSLESIDLSNLSLSIPSSCAGGAELPKQPK